MEGGGGRYRKTIFTTLTPENMAVDNNYRATLCVSAVFDVGRCLSVRHVRVLYPDS